MPCIIFGVITTISSYWEHVQDARDMVFLPCMHGQLLQVIWYGDQPAAVPTRQYFIDIAIQGSVVWCVTIGTACLDYPP